jgi:hydroxymethylglutaryl-CoA reductase (NADPH)
VPTDYDRIRTHLLHLHETLQHDLAELLLPDQSDVSPRVAGASRIDPAATERRWGLLKNDTSKAVLLDPTTLDEMPRYGANIENFIGAARVPIGIAGPLRVRGLHARGDFYVPLATTEAALVASYTRGAQTISEAGGCVAAVVNEGVTRSPAFVFPSVIDAGQFVRWITSQVDALKAEAGKTTRHGKLVDVRVSLEGNRVYLLLEFTTGDAAGQNMVTIATEAVCRYIDEHSPIRPTRWYVEANMSGDKKASHQSFQTVRGRKVVAEAILPADLTGRRLHCTPGEMVEYYRVSSMGGVLSGNIGINGHFANGMAALFIACGQDAACVAESAVGVTRMEVREDGALYVSVTLPNVIVGTVGGGTGLPTAKACLDLMGLSGAGKADALAEVCAALVTAGEVSIIAALAAGHFTRAHRKLARER